MEIVTVVFTVLVALGMITEIIYRIGHSNGYCKGVDEASGWRDKAIIEYQRMITEAIQQRDEARTHNRRAAPNPFSVKDLN